MTRIGSLCTGYGGLDMAVQQVFGGTVAWHCQYEPPDKDGREDTNQYAAQILAHHWPHIPNHGDLTKVDWAAAEPVDILTAGFPCQDVSLAGLRAGLSAATRSGLWRHVARAIEALQPRLVVIENVRGLLSAKADSGMEPCTWCVGDAGGEPPLRALGAVLADLARLGFDAEWACVRASEVGAPHQRERVFLLAWPADPEGAGRARSGVRGPIAERGAAAAEPECPTCGCPEWKHDAGGFCAGCPGCTDPGLGQPDDAAADAAGVGEREPADEAHAVAGGGNAREVSGGRGGAPTAHTDRGGRPRNTELPTGRNAVQQRVRDHTHGRDDSASDATGDRRHQGRPERAGQQRRPDAALSSTQGVEWGEYEPAVRQWERILGRLAPPATDALGRLSPALVEWMMGLPAGHVTSVPGLPRGAQLKALGNGVVPQQAAAALRLLAARVDAGWAVAS